MISGLLPEWCYLSFSNKNWWLIIVVTIHLSIKVGEGITDVQKRDKERRIIKMNLAKCIHFKGIEDGAAHLPNHLS